MKKTWHTVFLILLICLDAALLLLPLLPGYRALFDIGPYPDRLPAFRFLKLAGYALFFPLTAYGCGRLLARIRTPRLRWLPAAVFALIATALVCLHNNELHMLCRLDSGWVHVPHMYENLVRADLTYRGGLGIFRYVLPWAGTFLLCVLAGTYSLQQFLSLCRKAFAALRRRCLLRRTQARQALPCSLLVLSMADRAQFAAELADRLDHAHVVRTGGVRGARRCGGVAVRKRRPSDCGGSRGVCLRHGAVAESLRVFLPEHHRGRDRCHRSGGQSGKNRAGILVPHDLRLPVFRPNAERMTGGRNIHI